MTLVFRSFALLIVLALASLAASAQTLSASKLSAHLINSYTVGGSNILSGHPRTLKVLGLDSGWPADMISALRDYKAKVPGGKLVVRIYSPRNYSLADDATAAAGDFWTNILQQSLSYLSPADRALIDYLEGPNEGQTPTLGYPNDTPEHALQASQWFNQFWTNLTPRIVAAGWKPCIGSIAVGNPGGSPAEMQSYLDAFVPALRQAKAAGGAWSYHAYTIAYTTDVGTELWYSLRYRQFYNYFAGAYPDLIDVPLILTEGGVDQSGNPSTSGWQARGTAPDYQRWLNWFDQQLQQDPYVVGCTLFEIGNPEPWGWPSFDLEPIAGWLENYLLGPTTVPAPPAGLYAAAGNHSVTLTWTNVPLTPTSWSVKRSTNNGGPYFTLVTNLTAGVLGEAFTDSTAANSTTYYYAITAVNWAGESHNSAPVSATPLPPAYAAFNCGGPAAGGFQADGYYDAGTAYSVGSAIDLSGVVNPAPLEVYQSQRYGNVSYTFPFLSPNTSYRLRLHFAEIYWTAVGQRVFNVLINGIQVLANYDIVQAAGAPLKANIQEFNAVSDASGTLTVQLVTVTDNASINGIEILLNSSTGVPAAPDSLAALAGNGLVTLSWLAPPGAIRFSVKRSTASGGPYSLVATNLTQAGWRDPSVAVNTTYYYVVSASNAFGESADSLPASARPTTALPDLVVTSVTWAPAKLYGGARAVFSARVLNRGMVPTPNSKIGVAFMVDGVEVSWCGNYVASLPANASVTLQADGGPSGVNVWTATTGPHTLTAVVDDVGLITESIEDDNTATVPFTVFYAGYSLNSGGGAVGTFSADACVAGSANTYAVTNLIDTSGAANPAPMAVYQTERWGEFAYTLGNLVPGSNYTVRLHFAEISPSVASVGDRRFNVAVNGIQAVSDFDVLAAAGGKFRAVTRDIKKRADSSGTFWVWFTRGSANEPECCGIEVFGSAPPALAPAFTSYGDANGLLNLVWQTSPAVLYQVQFRDDLSKSNWTNLGNPCLASGSTLSFTNAVGAAAQRFYRIVQYN